MKIFEKYKVFVMVGKPGSGKGTQSELLSERSGFTLFSTGGKFRELQTRGDFLGQKIGNIIDNGLLTPYWLASFLFEEAVIYLPKEQGIIYEGAARKLKEAELFHEVMSWLERPYLAVHIEVSDEEVIRRLIKRSGIEDRADDDEDKIKVRLHVYKDEVIPAINAFEKHGTLLSVNGEQTPEKVFEEIMQKLSER